MTTFQDQQPQSRRAARERERALERQTGADYPASSQRVPPSDEGAPRDHDRPTGRRASFVVSEDFDDRRAAAPGSPTPGSPTPHSPAPSSPIPSATASVIGAPAVPTNGQGTPAQRPLTRREARLLQQQAAAAATPLVEPASPPTSPSALTEALRFAPPPSVPAQQPSGPAQSTGTLGTPPDAPGQGAPNAGGASASTTSASTVGTPTTPAAVGPAAEAPDGGGIGAGSAPAEAAPEAALDEPGGEERSAREVADGTGASGADAPSSENSVSSAWSGAAPAARTTSAPNWDQIASSDEPSTVPSSWPFAGMSGSATNPAGGYAPAPAATIGEPGTDAAGMAPAPGRPEAAEPAGAAGAGGSDAAAEAIAAAERVTDSPWASPPRGEGAAEPGPQRFDAQVIEPPVARESYTPPANHWSRMAQLDDETQPRENTLSRDVGGSNLSTATSALILPSIPQSDFSSVINGTGEILVTGRINLPESLSTLGGDSSKLDNPDVDRMLDAFDAELVSNDSAPVRAIRAVSTHSGSNSIIAQPQKQRSNRLLVIAMIATGVLVLATVGLLAVYVLTMP